MLKRDFILVQIEELGKVLAQLFSRRNEGASRKNEELLQVAYTTLKIKPENLLAASPEEIRSILNQEDGKGLQRMELAAKTLVEESYLYPERQVALRNKAKEILEYVQQNDSTYSLERIKLLQDLSQLH